MNRPVTVTLTRGEAEEISVAAALALSDEEFMASPDTQPAVLLSAIVKLASVAPPTLAQRLRKQAGKAAIVGALVVASVVGIPAFDNAGPQPADAAPLFDEELYRTVTDAANLVCDRSEYRLMLCRDDHGVPMRIEAYEGPGGRTYIVTYTEEGHAHRDEFRVHQTPDALERLKSAADDDPQAFPNFYIGDTWAIQGSDAMRVTAVAAVLGDEKAVAKMAELRQARTLGGPPGR